MQLRQPVTGLHPMPKYRSLGRTTRLNFVPLALGLSGLFWVVSSTSLAAENLWLDIARSSISSSELHGHVSILADDILEGREAGSRGGRAAAKYLIARLEEAGLQAAGTNGQFMQPLDQQTFEANGQNLLAVLPGSDPELRDEYIVVGAHYDHVGYGSRHNSYGPWGLIHNGADDNASGVAAVLEVIDALTQTGHHHRRSILFAFWDGEEKGLLGSKHWKKNPTIPLEAVKFAWNIDMVGRMDKGRIEVGGTRNALGVRRLLSSSKLSEQTWLDFTWEYKSNSDHWTFYEAGIPSLYLHTGLHEDYHRPTDDIEKLNVDGIRQVSAYLLEQLSKLAEVDQLPTFRADSSHESPALQRHHEQPLAKLALRFDFTWEYLTRELVASVPDAVVVKQVPRTSQAKLAGLVAGDRIVAVNGQAITSKAMLPAFALDASEEIELLVERVAEDAPVRISLQLLGSPTRLGLSWRADPAEPRSVYVTRVVPCSAADRAGIQLHDRLHAFNEGSISGPEELLARVQSVLDQGEKFLHFQVESRGAIREVAVQLGPPAVPSADATL